MDSIQKKYKIEFVVILLILVLIIILALIHPSSPLVLRKEYASVLEEMTKTRFGTQYGFGLDIKKIDIRMDKNTKDASTNPITMVDHLYFDIEVFQNTLTDDEILELGDIFTKILDEEIPELVNKDTNNKLVVEMSISPLSVQVVDGNKTYKVAYYRDISKDLNEFIWTSGRTTTIPHWFYGK